MSELSPMMSHYLKVKEENKDTIVFYRLGDFYEMFFEDAELASRELELTLTGRDCGNKKRAPMCGVPFHSVDAYIAKLISRGYKIAICDQMDDPSSAKGLISREVTRIITPGTIIESSMLDEGKNNFICSMYKADYTVGLSFCDISTGELFSTEVKNKSYEEIIERELIKFQPREILLNNKTLDMEYLPKILKEKLSCTVDMIDDSVYDKNTCVDIVLSQLKMKTVNELGIEDKSSILFSLGALFNYLMKTQKTQMNQISSLEVYTEDQFMNVDLVTRRNLELVETMRNKEKRGSLLWILDKTKTAMGKRLIRSWIERPLVNKTRIVKRQDAVEEFFSNVILMDDLSIQLSGIYDLERLISKISCGSANARELKALAFTIKKIPQLKKSLENVEAVVLKRIYLGLDSLEDIRSLINLAIVDEPPVILKEGGIIKKGYNEDLDSLKSDFENANGLMTALEVSEKKKTGISKLKISYNKIFGYYIEVTNSFKDKVPDRYIRKQTLANCERYITEELKNLGIRVIGAKEKSIQLECEIFEEVRKQISDQLGRIQKTAKMIASLDAVLSFAKVASESNYSRPLIEADGQLILKDSRHPVAECLMDGAPFVPNDVSLNKDDNRIYTITGPNMAGKSTYMRQVALITLMAQIGSFVPASHAQIGIVDSIFTRVGASDDLMSGQSTFMVEMNEVAQILKNATDNSLLIFDEIGRGTSTFDGMSIARAVLEYVSGNVRAKTLFATHYHELTILEGAVEGVKNYNIAVKKRGDDITFLRRIVRGGTDDSYGIEVAKLAGIPEEIIVRAKEILKDIESEQNSYVKATEQADPISTLHNNKSIKENELKVIDIIKKIDVTTITPIEAMSTLFNIAKILS